MTDYGLRFNAKLAVESTMRHDRRMQDIYEKVLVMCLKQIQENQRTQRSIIFDIPPRLCSEILAYDMQDITQYLITALRDDRQFIVINHEPGKLFIRWESDEQRRARRQERRKKKTMRADGYPEVLPSVPDSAPNPCENKRKSSNTLKSQSQPQPHTELVRDTRSLLQKLKSRRLNH